MLKNEKPIIKIESEAFNGNLIPKNNTQRKTQILHGKF